MNKISINPFTITHTHTIKALSINKIDIILNKSATISFTFFNDNGTPVESGWIKLEGAEYDAWGSDDNYIVTKILSSY